MESVTRVQTLDEAVCISLCANALRKGMNLSVLTPSYGHNGLATNLGGRKL